MNPQLLSKLWMVVRLLPGNPQITTVCISICFVLIVLTGCYQNLAPVEIGEGSIYSKKTLPSKPLKKPRDLLVYQNDSVSAREMSKPKNSSIKNEKRVSENQKEIMVYKGDTLYQIARRHQVSVRSIIRENALKAPFKLFVGQSLKLPKNNFYTVQEGDTLYSVAKRFKINLNALVRVNDIAPPYMLSVGDNLRLPTLVARAASARQVSQSKVVQEKKMPEENFINTVPVRSGQKFMWSARGKIISDFGPKTGGLHNDGINLAVPTGTPVRATENGLVVYSGNELPGYGNLLLIRHSDGWISAYAHNQSLKVARGDLVKRGEIISYAGSTGNVSSPQLHFELRLYGKPVNPIRYLAHQEKSQ